MNVVVLYNDPDESRSLGMADPAVDLAGLDVFVQRDAVAAALKTLGHDVHTVACTANLGATWLQLHELQPSIVFNLVESLLATDRMMPAATLLLESMELPFTGAGTEALLQSGNKLAAKRRLASHDLPIPVWLELNSPRSELATWNAAQAAARADASVHTTAVKSPPRMIVKANWEHASAGMLDSDVMEWQAAAETLAVLRQRRDAGRPAALAEAFVDGREFNLSLLAKSVTATTQTGNTGPDVQRNVEVLPPAEIVFDNYPVNKPRIVGYAAKWDEQSFEYQRTPRRFEFEPDDAPLLQRLRKLAVEAWYLFDMRGYARVDFRVDARGRPSILEINANPCLSPDAGFVAALEQAQIPFATAVKRILLDAMAT